MAAHDSKKQPNSAALRECKARNEKLKDELNARTQAHIGAEARAERANANTTLAERDVTELDMLLQRETQKVIAAERGWEEALGETKFWKIGAFSVMAAFTVLVLVNTFPK